MKLSHKFYTFFIFPSITSNIFLKLHKFDLMTLFIFEKICFNIIIKNKKNYKFKQKNSRKEVF
ncbi:Predicted protein [Mesomycoplasma hyopneumoniae 168]|uniref:Uncharacterized protein n=2 Tax=Mesomycoplasma hyopneumoniae (strain 168) TaxID=907287 RepID=E4QS21_MESH1|nr:Predicted protein [Mesomycoplasma hyopneumoniae 168]AGM21798.1 hypothetical protein MHP168L_018 [Mesomycoplasma hyopneumoniae 168-L]MXR10456.1 hypothetical protein [Mesomycoplasma hyopneumoniae]MXR13150.1 hypothetical protein [Mesomycoplasma hyopneumoniae]MXR44219.1 hypothetical protein [Mesomycoplasma hyopneumoniae]